MADINIIDSAIKNTILNEASIQVSLSGCSFLIKDKPGKVLAFKHYSITDSMLEDEIVRKTAYRIENEELLKNNFPLVRFIYLNQKSVLVPEEFFDVNQLKKVFEYNLSLGEYEELHVNHIHEQGTYNVFAVPSYLASILSSKFQKVEFIHQGSLLIKEATKLYHNGSKVVILININRSFFDLTVIKEKKLLLYNSYQYVNQTDFIYFLLYALKQLDIEIENTVVKVSGEACDDMQIISELKNYAPGISYLGESLVPDEQKTFRKLDTRKYHLLF